MPAAFVLAFAATVHPGAAAPHPGAKVHAASPSATTVRVQAVSGMGQTVRAYVLPDAPKYLAEFPKLLVVRVSEAAPSEGFRVRFRCVTPGCILAAVDQPDEGKNVERIDRAAYKAKLVKGMASLRVAIEGDSPDAPYTIRAEPITEKGERGVGASFTLILR